MTDQEKKLILDLSLHKITKEQFLSKYSEELVKDKNYVLRLLEKAYEEKSAEDVEYALLLGFLMDLFTVDYVNILCKILVEDWHYKHEDIVLILQDIKSPKSVDALYTTALKKLDYLNYDKTYALARKCVHALAAINTDEAIERLKLLAASDIPIIKEKAEKQLRNNQ